MRCFDASWTALLVALFGDTERALASACVVDHLLGPTGDTSGEADLLALRSVLADVGDGHCISFQAGDYFFDANPLARTFEEPPGCAGKRKCADAVAHLEGLRDVVVSGPSLPGRPARLLITNFQKDRGDQPQTTVWNLFQCANITIQQLTMEHTVDSLSHLVARVVSVSSENSLLVKVPAEYLPLQPASYVDIDGEAITVPAACRHLEAILGWCGDWCGVAWGAVACVVFGSLSAIWSRLGSAALCAGCPPWRRSHRCRGLVCGGLVGVPLGLASSRWGLGGPVQDDAFFAVHLLRLDAQERVTGWEVFLDKAGTGRAYDAAVAADQGECQWEGCLLLRVSLFHEVDAVCRTPMLDVSGSFVVGDHLLALHQKRAVAGVWFDDVDGLVLRDLTFGNLAGPSIAGSRVRNIHVSRQVARRPEVGWRTVNDALWVRGYAGSSNVVEDMTLEHLTDDFMNFHTMETGITGSSAFARAEEVCMDVGTPWWWDEPAKNQAAAWAKVNDTILFFSDDQVLISQAEFRGRHWIDDQKDDRWAACFVVIPGFPLLSVASRIAFAATPRWMPPDESEALVVRNVTVRNSRSRGMIKGSHTLVDGIEVVDNMMTALAIVSEPCKWGEGTSASDVTIRNGVFDNVALNTRGHIAAIEVFTHSCAGGSGLRSIAVHGAHSNISIVDVVIRNQPQAAIFAAGVQGLRIENLSLEAVAAVPDLGHDFHQGSCSGQPSRPGAHPISTLGCSAVVVVAAEPEELAPQQLAACS
mmetsp:Transcript_70381/g.199734  ORF Transcript_70381/g.199734 Transcript_70381/m.199734 type:complete len:758 (-) Transcript_70381:382-2655(-)